jgi:hypothetical protein
MFDRHLGKTGDAYVECPTQQDARNIWSSLDRYLQRTGKGRVVRNRVINFEIVTAGELCAMIFPKAKCTSWNGSDPIITSPREAYEAPFDGFITEEELRNLVQHTRRPGQGQHGKDSPQRPFENMISILQKYPWSRTNLYTVEHRNLIFTYLCKMIEELVKQIKDCRDGRGIFGQRNFSTKITQRLLEEMVTTACTYGNFTLRQQHTLISLTHVMSPNSRVSTAVMYPLFRLSSFWPFEAIVPRRGTDEVLLEFYARLIYVATTSNHVCPIDEIFWAAVRNEHTFQDPFGGLSIDFIGERRAWAVNDVAGYELYVIGNLFKRLIPIAKLDRTLELMIPTHTRVPYLIAGPYP